MKVAPVGEGQAERHHHLGRARPDGTQLGITRQSKNVRKGSLDKKWGAAAEAAAAAAAADIAKLIPR